MNIIKQIKDENGNNIYPIGFAQGGMKMDLLWTNPSPTSAFSAQTINIDYSDYDLIFIDYLLASSVGTDILFSACHKVYDVVETYFETFWHSSEANKYGRNLTLGADKSSVTFTTGYENNTAKTTVVIPYHIYGFKLSYIVPTSVYGLQYVEV